MTSCLCLSGWLHTLCSGDNDCERSNAKCYKGECLCTPGFYYSVGNETCVDCEFTSRAAPRCTGAAMFHLGWLSLAALYWVFSRFLARLLLRKYLPHNRKTHPYHCSRQLFIQVHGSENLSMAYTSLTLSGVFTLSSPFVWILLHSLHLHNTCWSFFWILLHRQHLYNTCWCFHSAFAFLLSSVTQPTLT